MSSINKKIYFVIALFCFLNSNAQEAASGFRSSGALIGYGQQLNNTTPYNPIFFSGDISRQFAKRRSKMFLGYYIAPQFNVVLTGGPLEVEFGSNFGFRFYQRISKDVLLYQMAGTGPHFITANITRQARGFIFSDNIAIGLLKKISGKIALNFQVKVRHISNAGIKRPNGGVNSLNIKIGLSKINTTD